MPKRFLISRDSQVLYITVVTKDRLPVFRTDAMRELACSAIDEARRSAGLLLFAYVIMLDHMHLLTSCPSKPSDVLRVLKGITARRVIDYLPIFSEGMFMEKVNYIHENPVRAGLVTRATDYRWSSARIWQSSPWEDEPLLMDKELIYWRQSRR